MISDKWSANAISDIYAMGGKPLTALNIVAFPISTLDKQVLTDILRGAGDKLKEAGLPWLAGTPSMIRNRNSALPLQVLSIRTE